MMAHKTLTISEEAYLRLVKAKVSEGESFTEVIIRLTAGRANLLTLKGSWKDIDDKEVELTFKKISEAWKRWKAQ